MLKENFVPPPNNHKFYVYLHRRLDNNNIFYVGKGKINHNKNTFRQTFIRAFDKCTRTRHWKNIYAICGRIVSIEKTFVDENDALNYESKLILDYKKIKNGGTLVNCYTFGSEYIENLLISKISSRRIKIYQYDIDGYFIKEFDSITEASIEVNSKPTDISVALGNVKNRIRHTVKGFRWSVSKVEKLDIPKSIIKNHLRQRIIGKTVYQYTFNHEFIKEWVDSTEIMATLNLHGSAIRNNLCGLSKSCNGYYFSYNPPEMIEPIDTYTKVCIKCSERKELSEFYDAPVNKDGKSGACITCLKIYKKEQNLKNRLKKLKK